VALARLRSLFKQALNKNKQNISIRPFNNPASFLASLMKKLGEEEIIENFEDLAQEIINEHLYEDILIGNIDFSPKLKIFWLEKLKENAGSEIFNTANNFVGYISDNDEFISNKINERDAFELIIKVYYAAYGRSMGAHSSQSLCLNRFSTVPYLKKKALDYIENRHEEAANIFEQIHPPNIFDPISPSDNLNDFVMKHLKENAP